MTRYATRVNPFLKPADRKKVLMALYRKFNTMGDGAIRGGKHMVMLATEGYRTIALEDQPDDEIIRLARKHGIMSRPNPRRKLQYGMKQVASSHAGGVVVKLYEDDMLGEYEVRVYDGKRQITKPFETNDLGLARRAYYNVIKELSGSRANPITTKQGRKLRAKGSVRAAAKLLAARNAGGPKRKGRLTYQSAQYILSHHSARKRRKTVVRGAERARVSHGGGSDPTVPDVVVKAFG